MGQTTQKGHINLTSQEAQQWFANHQKNNATHPYARKGQESIQILKDQFNPVWKDLKRRILASDKQVIEIPIQPKHSCERKFLFDI